MGLQHFKL